MMVNSRFSALVIAALIAIPACFGQSRSSGSEMSVEESYLQEAVDLMIVREASREDSLNQKLLALEFIGELLENGSTNEEILYTLERLSLEGTSVQVREKGRIKYDYPQVRREASKHLGTVGTSEAKAALLRVCLGDDEPLVLQEAVRSLGIIGIDNNGEVTGTIVWVGNKFHNTIAPDNLLALAVVDALDKLASKNNGVSGDAIQLLIKIWEGPYAPPVREKARQVLMDFRKYSAVKR